MRCGLRHTARTVGEREQSAREVVGGVLAAIEVIDPELRAFTGVDPGLALAAADDVDRRVAAGERLPLAGVPVGIKELVAVAGLPQGYGTEAMPRIVAARDADCVRRLRLAGAIPIGVTRTSELAWREDTPPTMNPLDPALSCGGSSGGSGAAVAAGLVPLAIGTDTGGSIRLPAALCGCCGYKPSFGAVAVGGVLPVSPSLDHVGPLARSVDDLRLALAALTGREVHETPRGASGLRLGVVREDDGLSDDPELYAALSTLHDALAAEGAELCPISLRFVDAAYGVVDTISLAEGWRVFAGALDAPREQLFDVTRMELEAASRVTGDAWQRARRMRAAIAAEMTALLVEDALDAIVLPALSLPAPRRGAPPGARRLNAPLPPANVTGQPACVLPLRLRPLPLAVQLLGHAGGDDALLAVAATVERLIAEG